MKTTPKVASRNHFISCQHFAAGRTSLREPRGTQHLRRLGDMETACGQWAMDWPMYFDRKIDVRSPHLCHECARRIGLRA
jgi:hypothetical protein